MAPIVARLCKENEAEIGLNDERFRSGLTKVVEKLQREAEKLNVTECELELLSSSIDLYLVSGEVLFPMCNSRQESAFAVYKSNQKLFLSLRELNLRGQSLAQTNHLLDWISEKPAVERDQLFEEAKDNRKRAMAADVERLDARMNAYLTVSATNERLV